MIKLATLFSGIGAIEQALDKIKYLAAQLHYSHFKYPIATHDLKFTIEYHRKPFKRNLVHSENT